MKKNVFMRAALLLLVLTLITSCFVGGTFAKYATTVSSADNARIAHWGWNATTIDLGDLFKVSYATDDTTTYNGANSVDSVQSDVIAPGTHGSASFGFSYSAEGSMNNGAPEVAYKFDVLTTNSECDVAIQNNPNIQWALDFDDTIVNEEEKNAQWLTWEKLLEAIALLSGDPSGSKVYGPGELPAAFNNNQLHTVSWRWVFGGNEAMDTEMGNAGADLARVMLSITVNATQVD